MLKKEKKKKDNLSWQPSMIRSLPRLPHGLQRSHIFGQQQGLLQGLGQVMGMPFLELPDGGALWYGRPLQLQLVIPH